MERERRIAPPASAEAEPTAAERAVDVKSLLCERLGNPAATGPDAPLSVARRAPAPLAPNCVRIRVAAAALNFADLLQVQGKYQVSSAASSICQSKQKTSLKTNQPTSSPIADHDPNEKKERPRLPFVPGSECSGVVVEAGRDVRALKVGDRVAAVTPGGAFAEEVVAPVAGAVRLPASCDLEEAAGLPVAYGTAWMALHDEKLGARVRQGETVLVLGAGGGVGLAAVQLARLAGARVVAAARGAGKAAALAPLADAVVDTAGRGPEALRAAIKAAAGPRGVDVLFDPVGEPLFGEALRAMAPGGRVCIIGFAGGRAPAIPANILLVKNLTVRGLYWGSTMQRDPAAFRRSLEAVARLYAAGDLAVPVSHRYSLEQAAEAFSVLAARAVVGKLLFLPAPRSML
jgi:NADPH2:quinone reductase